MNMRKIKLLFLGSGDFAILILEKLLNLDFADVVGVITQPDKKGGRGLGFLQTPIKQYLIKNKIEELLLQPESIKSSGMEILDNLCPDIIIVASYGQILPKDFIDFPKYKTLNVHASLLPKLRGAVPVQMAILQKFHETGVSIQIMSEEMDKGDIIGVRKLKLSGLEYSDELMSELSEIGSSLLVEVLPQYINGEILPTKQNESDATYCYKRDISRVNAEINFETDIELAFRMVRAFVQWPVAWFKFNNKVIKIYKAEILNNHTSSVQNLTLAKESGFLVLKFRNGTLKLLEIQLEGKKRMSFKDYFFLVN